jgi:Domain of unknown function (DUF4868)
MPAQFNVNAAEIVEFGVGTDEGRSQRYVSVPIDAEVQAALREMVLATRKEMKAAGDASTYDPGEKYSGHENLRLPIDSDLASHVLLIHNAANLPSEPKALSDPTNVFCYFTRMRDGKSRLTAIRRATSFKGVLKSRLLQFTTDALKIVPDKIFKLDQDFDLLVDDTGIQILRPAGFEFVGALEGAILGAVPKNVKALKGDLPFVEFDGIETYASKHPRAARYLASIRTQQETKNVDKGNLKDLCHRTGVKFIEAKGKLVIDEGSIMDFLGVLDRRLYEVELVKGEPESFRAASRSRIS